jgi:predicted RNase H-like HicB family nuclease
MLMVREAIGLYIESLVAHDEKIPEEAKDELQKNQKSENFKFNNTE